MQAKFPNQLHLLDFINVTYLVRKKKLMRSKQDFTRLSTVHFTYRARKRGL